MTIKKKIDLLKKRFHDSYFRKKTVPKLLSVLFAIIFWLYVMDQVNPEMVRSFPNIPVDVLNMEVVEQNHFKVIEDPNHLVTVKVKGRRKAVMNIKPEDIVLSIDLKNFKKGFNQFPIDRKIYSDSVEFDSLSENRIPLTVEAVLTSSKVVEIQTTGILPEGSQLGQMSIVPERIEVSGPESYVKSVAKIVGTLDLTTAQDNMSKTVELVAQDQYGKPVKGVELSESNVVCTFGVLKTQDTTIIADIQGALPSGLALTSVQMTPQTLPLTGNAQGLTQVKSISTKPIDLSTIDQSVELEEELIFPNGVTAANGTQKVKVRVTVETIDLKEIEYQGNEIILKNIPSGMQIKLKDGIIPVKVKLRGAKSVIEQLDATSLKLILDCSKVTLGVNILPIEFEHGLKYPPDLVATPSTVEIIVSKK